jgi:hypothetical protein
MNISEGMLKHQTTSDLNEIELGFNLLGVENIPETRASTAISPMERAGDWKTNLIVPSSSPLLTEMM